MPFDYQKFDMHCATMSTDELLKQHKHYTNLSSVAMTSTTVSALSMIPTLGLSGLGIAASAPAHHNAKKKKQIVEKYLKARGIEASQATEYANALAANENQRALMNMAMNQQAMHNQYVDPSSPAPSDRKYNYSNDHDSISSKKSSLSQQENIPPPPPTYDEAQSSQSYSQAQQQQQQYGPSHGMGTEMGIYNQSWTPQGYASPSQQRYMSPPPQGYGSPSSPPPQQVYGYPPQGSQGNYCAPQSHMWPNSAIQYQHPDVERRHVHFTQ